MAKYCKCGAVIPNGRLKALPGVTTCISCSSTERVRGHRIISGKTSYTEMEIVSPDMYSELKQKQERRGMSPGTGVRLDKK